MRPTLKSQVQSYAQWRLSADLRSTARTKTRASGMRSEVISTNDAYMHPQTGRRRSCSASSVEFINRLRSLQQEVDAMKAAGSIGSVAPNPSSVCNSGDDTIQQSCHRRTRSQPPEFGRDNSSQGAIRSIKQTRDSLRRTNKASRRSGPQKRPSRQRDQISRDPTIYNGRDSERAYVELYKRLNLLSGGRAYEDRYGSRGSSVFDSNTQSSSLSDTSSASSLKSTTESLDDISEATIKDACKACGQKSERGTTASAAIPPVSTLPMLR